MYRELATVIEFISYCECLSVIRHCHTVEVVQRRGPVCESELCQWMFC